ncbi:MAG: phage tail protein [Anaerolineae bacterium]
MTTSSLRLDHVVDAYRRYPGEALTFYTRVSAQPSADGAGVSPHAPSFTLRITLPAGIALEHTEAPPEVTSGPRVVAWPEGGQTITWSDVPPADAAQTFVLHTSVDREIGLSSSTEAEVSSSSLTHDAELVSRAFLEVAGDESPRVTETVSVAVFSKSRYLRHLPALYERDALLNRFLMLFESFWDPIEAQIDQLPYTFDPRTAPSELLPWLAAWLDLVLDPRWPEAKRRRLLQSAVHLYRRRGTRDGLADYLEIYTGVRPQIVEHRAENFVLGPEARLGQSIALGRRNAPHTFTVKLELPTLPKAEAEARRRMITQIIEAEKPAHTAYLLDLS